MDEWIEELRKELHKAMDGQDKELHRQISQELDRAIVEYIRGREESNSIKWTLKNRPRRINLQLGLFCMICCGPPRITDETTPCTGVENGTVTFNITQDICVRVPIDTSVESNIGDTPPCCGYIPRQSSATRPKYSNTPNAIIDEESYWGRSFNNY